MDFDSVKFSYRLNCLLEENNMSQTDLSKKIEISNVTICRYLTGDRTPRIDVITRIATFFNVSIDYLLGRSESKDITYSSDNFDFDVNMYIKKLFNLNNKTRISKRQIKAVEKLLLANKEFILFAK